MPKKAEIETPGVGLMPSALDASLEQEREESWDAEVENTRAVERDKESDAILRTQVDALMAKVEEQAAIITDLGKRVGGLTLPGKSGSDAAQYMVNQVETLIDGRPTVKILLQTSENPGQNWPVDVSINGKKISIPRGEIMEIPSDYVRVLQNAVVDSWHKFVGADGGITQTRVHFWKYPFSIVG